MVRVLFNLIDLNANSEYQKIRWQILMMNSIISKSKLSKVKIKILVASLLKHTIYKILV
jgi:hypothetical protein